MAGVEQRTDSDEVPSPGRWAALRIAGRLIFSAAPKETALIMVLTVSGAVLTAAELLVGRELVDLLVDGDDVTLSDLTPWLILLGASLVATSLVNAGAAELKILISELVQRRAVDELLEVATAAELEAFEDPQFHDRIRLAREHADTRAWQVVWGLVTLATTAFSSIAVVLVLLGVAPLLVPVAALGFAPIAFVTVRNTRALYRMHYELAEADRDRAYHERLLTDRLDAREVRAYGLATWLRARHDALFAERIHNTREVVTRRTGLALIGSSVTSLVLVATLAIVMVLALDDRLTVGDAALAVVALQQLAGRLRSSGAAMESLTEGVAYLREFQSLRSLLPPTDSSEQQPSRSPAPHPRELRLHDVGYGYPTADANALNGVNLSIRPGEVLAIVGPNGAGKSTLAKLLCGLLPTTSGRILWDGVDVKEFDPARLRELAAPVFQDFTRYEHTAAEAIGFGAVDRMDDREAIERAARAAGVAGFVEALPNGYDTRLSTSFTGGAELSVGQWQRLAIARAFFRDAPLVVMDEPAASLDARAERDLFDRLTELGRDRMVVFISHRFATVRRADSIQVLLDGNVAERGTHDELMSLGGVYAELYTLQAVQFS